MGAVSLLDDIVERYLRDNFDHSTNPVNQRSRDEQGIRVLLQPLLTQISDALQRPEYESMRLLDAERKSLFDARVEIAELKKKRSHEIALDERVSELTEKMKKHESTIENLETTLFDARAELQRQADNKIKDHKKRRIDKIFSTQAELSKIKRELQECKMKNDRLVKKLTDPGR